MLVFCLVIACLWGAVIAVTDYLMWTLLVLASGGALYYGYRRRVRKKEQLRGWRMIRSKGGVTICEEYRDGEWVQQSETLEPVGADEF